MGFFCLFFYWMHRIKAPVAVRTECSLKSCPYDVTIKTALLIPTMIPVRFLTPLLHPSRSVSVSSLNMPTAGTGRDVWPAPTFRGWRRWSIFNRKVNNIPRKKNEISVSDLSTVPDDVLNWLSLFTHIFRPHPHPSPPLRFCLRSLYINCAAVWNFGCSWWASV